MALRARQVRVDVPLDLPQYNQLKKIAKDNGRSIRGLARIFVVDGIVELTEKKEAVEASKNPGTNL